MGGQMAPTGMRRRATILALALPALLLLLAACQAPEAGPAAAPDEQAQDTSTATEAADSQAQAQALPLGPPPVADELSLPPGMAGIRWAEGLQQPAAIAFDGDGTLLVAEATGRIWRLQDADGDHRADAPQLVVEGLGEVRGLAVATDGSILISQRGQVSRATDSDGDGAADLIVPIVRGLPERLHANNGLVEGPDGLIYVAVGSTCNDCVESSPLSATIIQIDPATSAAKIYATGLRNPYGLVFSPDGALWSTDQGSQSPCTNPDELNRILPGAHYGWPYCVAEEDGAGASGPAALLLGTETGAAGIAWIDSPVFAQEFRRGLFVALSTQARTVSTQPGDPVGASVQFVAMDEDGALVLRAFASGLRRPLAVAVGPRDGVYIADADTGVIYRIGAPLEE